MTLTDVDSGSLLPWREGVLLVTTVWKVGPGTPAPFGHHGQVPHSSGKIKINFEIKHWETSRVSQPGPLPLHSYMSTGTGPRNEAIAEKNQRRLETLLYRYSGMC